MLDLIIISKLTNIRKFMISYYFVKELANLTAGNGNILEEHKNKNFVFQVINILAVYNYFKISFLGAKFPFPLRFAQSKLRPGIGDRIN